MRDRSIVSAPETSGVLHWDDDARARFREEVTRSRRFDRSVALLVIEGSERPLTAMVVGAVLADVRRYDLVVVDTRRSRLGIIAPETPRTTAEELAVRLETSLGERGMPVQVSAAAAPEDGTDLDDVARAAVRRALPAAPALRRAGR